MLAALCARYGTTAEFIARRWSPYGRRRLPASMSFPTRLAAEIGTSGLGSARRPSLALGCAGGGVERERPAIRPGTRTPARKGEAVGYVRAALARQHQFSVT